MAHISEYEVETKFIDRLESIGYEYVELKNYDLKLPTPKVGFAP
jgi:type I restriction enzyme R subunit